MPSTSTSATTTASIFLWTSIPAIRYGMRALLEGAESVPRRINQGRELSLRENTATLNYSVNFSFFLAISEFSWEMDSLTHPRVSRSVSLGFSGVCAVQTPRVTVRA